MDEHALSLNGDAAGVSDMAHCECLGSVDPVDVGLRAQRRPEGCAAEVPQGQGAGVGRLARLMCRGAEDVIEDQSAYAAVNMPGRSLVSGAEHEVRVHRAVGALMNDEGRRDWIASADNDVPQCHALTVGGLLYSE